ncbi:MAG TPA: response regulator transcription factor, partial [Acidimicrobiales bacterium]|nr:response regulator transcription factor [Acidimicrobiales bacterium]
MHRIVIVDDSREVRAALRVLLEHKGFEVVAETADYDEAVDLVVTAKPNAVLLDWMFDGKPGGALALASLRRWAPEVPVVVYTAYPDEAATSAKELGAAFVATKQIAESTDLARVVGAVIDEWDLGGAPPSRGAHGEAGGGLDQAQVGRTAAMA